ncbi:hypothetical protein OESDEN_06918 [Oesophagostomum dentatum]|uniref:Uncharacterized protein n=1 Tax=Oesophagostomum dentatum TaxID=61180 RepID=A0A0B1T7I2_OESDE|nr:hypothetical protein OESDEN_06918 [Oesophagostomum dentatum]
MITGADLMSGCSDVKCLLTSTNLGRELGQSIAGSVFHITTKRTMFPTVEITTDQLTQASAGVFIYTAVLLLGYLLFM